MSHFFLIALLPKDTPHAQKALEAALQPFHEFECDGVDDQYVVDVDDTDRLRREYAEETERRFRDPSGKLHYPYENRFYRDPTPTEAAKIGVLAGTGCGHGMAWTSKDWGDGKGYRTKVHEIPDGWEEVEQPASAHRPFAQWAAESTGREIVSSTDQIDRADKHKFGYIVVNGAGEVVKAVDRTNPNKKWDWWTVGGRYTGRLGDYDPEKDPANYETCFICGGTGTRADTTYGPEATWARAGNEVFPCVGRGCNACCGAGMQLKFASHFRDVGNIAPVSELPPDFSCFAILAPKGEWIEQGRMGFWAVVRDEKDPEAWKKTIRDVLKEHRDCIAVGVDCHI